MSEAVRSRTEARTGSAAGPPWAGAYPTGTPQRIDGYLPIGEYAVIGDGRTTALIGRDGRIDWWPVPTLDSPPVLAAILDPDRGGYLALGPAEPVASTQTYVAGTNVVETTHRTRTGTVVVRDSLNVGTAGRLPWTELARVIEGVEGQVAMRWEFVPGDRLRRTDPWVHLVGSTPLVTVEDQTLALVLDGVGDPETDSRRVSGAFDVRSGDTRLLAVVGTDSEPVFLPRPDAVVQRSRRSVESWRRWSSRVDAEGEFRDDVCRSALALKLLVMESTGAIAAAATTSLPEGIGGQKNWDYRYSWVRDSSFVLDALIRLDLHEEVHGAVSWLLDAIRRNGPHVHVFYSLDGSIADEYSEIDVPGYRASRPVRSGNSAAGQSQLGIYGDLLDTVSQYVGEGHVLDRGTAFALADLVEDCCDRWMQQDSGIWELAERHHYTISKIGCWVALDRAAHLARIGQLPGDRLARWEVTAQRVHDWVDEHCWSPTRQAYTFYAGSDEMDAAVLLAGRTGFDRGSRLSTTIDAVRDELGRGPLLYRYSGMDEEEGAFVACTFWMVDAMVRVGRREEALELMRAAVKLVNHAGLLSEEIDPVSGEFLGNFPQALSHLALINAAHTLGDKR
ncbi:MAG: glycoside hydrolase family 15 protein [Acidobacteriota bacterium]|nr:glycoside hydrolase family 15 protein [Acidobacteriota bacterium]